MGRTLPTECDHGAIIDWGDMRDEVEAMPEVCPADCEAAHQAMWRWRAEHGPKTRGECAVAGHPLVGLDDGRHGPDTVERCYCGEASGPRP